MNARGTLHAFAILFTVSALLLPPAASASELTFRQGDGRPGSTTWDTSIWQGAPTIWFGNSSSIQLDEDAIDQVGLYKVPDLFGTAPGQIPPGSIINSCTLTAYFTNPTNGTISVHQILVPWDENTVTWNTFGSAPGGVSGTDFDAAPGGTFIPATMNEWHSVDITSMCQAWSDGAPNHGIIMFNSGTDGAVFLSSEANYFLRPYLTVNWTPATVVTPAGVFATSQWGGGDDGKVIHLIDGSGLSGGGPVETQVHDNDPQAATMWHAGDVDGGLGGPVGLPPLVSTQAVVFDLGESQTLLGAYIWNHNQNLDALSGAQGGGPLTQRGVNAFDVLVSNDSNPLTASFGYVGSYNLAEAGGGAEPAQFIPFQAGDVRLVRFNISTAWSNNPFEYVGLSEVRFLRGLGVLSSPIAGGPAASSIALSNAHRNPGTSLAYRITVPDGAPRVLEVFDLSGRRIFSRDVAAYGPGTHVVNVEGVIVAPGVYLTRLSGTDGQVSTRSVVVR